jgi:chromate transporter
VEVALVNDPTWLLAAHLALLSIVSVGGAHAMLPDIYRFIVIEHGWLGGQEFATLVALGQAAPGPNVLVTTLLGYQIGGLACAIVAPLAFILPSSLAVYAFAHVDARGGDAPWKTIVKRGLAPLTVGLVIASGVVLAQGAGAGLGGYAVAGIVAVLHAFTRLHPLWLIGAGAVSGALL